MPLPKHWFRFQDRFYALKDLYLCMFFSLVRTTSIFFVLSLCMFELTYGQPINILKNPIHIDSVQSKKQDSGLQTFELKLQIAKDHFLYVEDLEVISELENLNNANFSVEASPIIEFKDKFSNNEIKKGLKASGTLNFNVPFGFNYNSKFKLSYRACTEEFCYLPKTISFDHGHHMHSLAHHASDLAFLGMKFNFDSSSYLLIFFIVFLAGILTSFTPCIFPLIPITLTLIQNNISLGRFKSFQKTLIFVFGIAFTYSGLGIIAASTGTFFGHLLSNTYALIIISVIYFLMALSLLGAFSIQFFGQLQNKFSKVSTNSNSGVFVFGMVTGIFASPCVGPILIAVLTYAAQSKNLIFAFCLLFTYALGLGQIFLVLSLFSNLINKLPRSGQWLNGMKYLLAGFLFIAGLLFFIPAVKSLIAAPKTPYNELLTKALQSNQIVIVDFKADWCGACLELENTTFKHPLVKPFLEQNQFLTIDVTTTDDITNELLQKYKVMGLPHVMFFDKSGNLLPDLTISSYITAEQMLERIKIINALGTDN